MIRGLVVLLGVFMRVVVSDQIDKTVKFVSNNSHPAKL